MGEATQQVGRAVFWSVLAKVGRFTLGLASSVIVVRGLGEHDYGVLSLARTALAFVLVIASVGLRQSLLRFLPELRVNQNQQGKRRFVLVVFAIQLVVWAALLSISYFAADWVEVVLKSSGIGIILVVAIALGAFELFFILISHILNAHYDTKHLSIATVLSHSVYIALLFVVLPRGYGVNGVLAAMAIGHGVAVLVLAPKLAALLRGEGEGDDPRAIETGRLLRFSLPFALIGILNVVVWRQSEVFFVFYFHGAELTGFFDLAYRLPQTLLEFIPGAVWPIVLAGFSEVYSRNPDSLRLAIDKYYRMLFLLSTPLCLFGVTFGGRIIPILYGEANMAAALPTQLFFAIFIVSFFGTPLSMALYVMEKSHVNLLIYLVLAVINIGLDLLLIPRLGIMGAVIPVAIVIAITPVIYKRVLARHLDGVTIPYAFIGRCFLAASPILLFLPFTGYVRGVPELLAVGVLSIVMVVLTAKKVRLIGREEYEMLQAVPLPLAHRLLRFMSS